MDRSPSGYDSESTLDRVRTSLFVGDIVTVGTWRCAVSDPLFRDSGPARCYYFCFPRTSVWIEHQGEPPFVADPNVVTFYNRGQVYNRYRLSDAGDQTDWFAVPRRIVAESLEGREPRIAEGAGGLFPFSHGPTDSATYLLQRTVLAHVNSSESPDHLFVEETALMLLDRVLECAYARRGIRRSAAVRKGRARELTEGARALLASRFTEALSLETIASLIGSSVFHLARTFRSETGSTLRSYRNRLRLRTSLDLLATNATLPDIARDLGYASHSHFSDGFRRQFGLTPSDVRRQLTSAGARNLARCVEVASSNHTTVNV